MSAYRVVVSGTISSIEYGDTIRFSLTDAKSETGVIPEEFTLYPKDNEAFLERYSVGDNITFIRYGAKDPKTGKAVEGDACLIEDSDNRES